MRLKIVQTNCDIFTPDGHGAKASYFRDKDYELSLEGAFIRFRSRHVKDSETYEIPMANVAMIARLPDEPANDNAKRGK